MRWGFDGDPPLTLAADEDISPALGAENLSPHVEGCQNHVLKGLPVRQGEPGSVVGHPVQDLGGGSVGGGAELTEAIGAVQVDLHGSLRILRGRTEGEQGTDTAEQCGVAGLGYQSRNEDVINGGRSPRSRGGGGGPSRPVSLDPLALPDHDPFILVPLVHRR